MTDKDVDKLKESALEFVTNYATEEDRLELIDTFIDENNNGVDLKLAKQLDNFIVNPTKENLDIISNPEAFGFSKEVRDEYLRLWEEHKQSKKEDDQSS